MSLALYRKYRPSTFSEVIGQEHVTEPLSNALESGKINFMDFILTVYIQYEHLQRYSEDIKTKVESRLLLRSQVG
jgi:hypothetical protein